jgi:hypothetical protein
MSLTVKESGTEFKQVAPGTYPARCIKVIDLGTQHSEYQGKPRTRQQIMVTWELPTEKIEEGEFSGQPYAVSKFYTASLGEKANLRKDLEAWRGRAFTEVELQGFNVKAILGKACMLSIIHNDKGRAKISGVMSLMKGVEVPAAINPLVWFDISAWDSEAFDNLSDGIKKLIHESDEYKSMSGIGGTTYEGGEDSQMPDESAIPF